LQNQLPQKKKKEKTLEEALKDEDKSVEKDDRKRSYNSLGSITDYKVTEQEMEAYLLKKKKFDDPMRSFVGN